MSSVAVAAAGHFRGLRAPGWRYRADWRRSVRHSAGAFRFVADAPVSLRPFGPSPWPGGRCREFIARAHLRKGEPEGGQERRGNGTPHVHRIREGTREVPLPPETCRAARGGLPSKRFALPLSLADAGGRGGRRDRRVAAARGIRLGLALCEGQRCHALMGNKHRPCQTLNAHFFSMLPFFMKMCRIYLCNAMHIFFAQTACTCANLSVPAGAQTRHGHPPPSRQRRRGRYAHPGTTHEAGRKTWWSPSGFGNWFAAVRMPAPSPAVTSCRMRRCIPPGALPDRARLSAASPGYSSQRTAMPALRRAAANSPSPSTRVREKVPS